MKACRAEALAWIITLGVAAWAIGAYPTWLLAGWGGLLAQGLAGGVVLLTTALSTMMIADLAARDPAQAAVGLAGFGAIRVMLAISAFVAGWKYLGLPPTPLLLWIVLFYVSALTGQIVWSVMALRPDPHVAAPGKTNRRTPASGTDETR